MKASQAIQDLARALEAGPTPGPWTYEPEGYRPEYVCGQGKILAHAVGDSAETQANAAFIAAANPEAIRALLAHVAALEKDAGWMPIETAPKDGQTILLGRVAQPETEDQEEADGISTAGFWMEAESDAPDNMGHDAGFMDSDFNYFECPRSFGAFAFQSPGIQPTHWKPFPKPPGHPSAATCTTSDLPRPDGILYGTSIPAYRADTVVDLLNKARGAS